MTIKALSLERTRSFFRFKKFKLLFACFLALSIFSDFLCFYYFRALISSCSRSRKAAAWAPSIWV